MESLLAHYRLDKSNINGDRIIVQHTETKKVGIFRDSSALRKMLEERFYQDYNTILIENNVCEQLADETENFSESRVILTVTRANITASFKGKRIDLLAPSNSLFKHFLYAD